MLEAQMTRNWLTTMGDKVDIVAIKQFASLLSGPC
jgi:hypothetical protein